MQDVRRENSAKGGANEIKLVECRGQHRRVLACHAHRTIVVERMIERNAASKPAMDQRMHIALQQ